MNRKHTAAIIITGLLALFLFGGLSGQSGLRPTDIIEKNIEAVGRGRLRAVKNISFKAGSSWYFVRSDGTMKILSGMMEPVVIVATLITREGIRQNALHDVRPVQGTEKGRFQCLARLAGVLRGGPLLSRNQAVRP
jgi:hypothetical protein